MGTGDRRAVNGVRRAPPPSGDPSGKGSAAQRRCLFLVLEGIDGSGKTEQAKLLANWLEGRGLDVVRTREPTDGPWGRKYRSWAGRKSEARAEEILEVFLEDRAEHVAGVILPALEKGRVIVCDRYNPSTLAYQAVHGVPREVLAAEVEARGFPEPDLVIWLRVPLETAVDRLGDRVKERYEDPEVLDRVDAEYARLGLQPISGTGTLEEVAARVRALVAPLLEERGLLKER
jgi:dTMP kinase